MIDLLWLELIMNVQTSDSLPLEEMSLGSVSLKSQQPQVSLEEETKRHLGILNETSEELMEGTATGSLSKQEIEEKIATLESRWKILINEGNRDESSGVHALGSEYNRVRLLYAYQNVLATIKVNVLNLALAEKEHDIDEMKGRTCLQTAYATAQTALSSLTGRKSNSSDVSYRDILNNITTHQDYISRDQEAMHSNGNVVLTESTDASHLHTGINIPSLKKTVAEESLSPQESAKRTAFERYNQEQLKNLDEEAKKIELLLDEAITPSVVSKCQDAMQSAVKAGSDAMEVVAVGVTNMALNALDVAGSMVASVAEMGAESLSVAAFAAGEAAVTVGSAGAESMNLAANAVALVVEDVVEAGHKKAIEVKDAVVKEKAMALDPSKLTGTTSLSEILDKYVWYWTTEEALVQTGITGAKKIAKIANKYVGKDFQTRVNAGIATNVKVLLEEENVKQLAGIAIRNVGQTLQSITEAGPHATNDEVMQHLKVLDQKPPSTPSKALLEAKTFEEYKTKAEASIIKTLSEKVVVADPKVVVDTLSSISDRIVLSALPAAISWVSRTWALVSPKTKKGWIEGYDKKVKLGEAKISKTEKLANELEVKLNTLKLNGASPKKIDKLQVELDFAKSETLRRKIKLFERKSASAELKLQLATDEEKSSKYALDRAINIEKSALPSGSLKAKEDLKVSESAYKEAQKKLDLAKETAINAFSGLIESIEKPAINFLENVKNEHEVLLQRHKQTPTSVDAAAIEASTAQIKTAEQSLAEIRESTVKLQNKILAISSNKPEGMTKEIMAALAAELGITEIVNRLGAHGEILCYYVVDKVVREMGSILDKKSKEATQKNPQLSETKPLDNQQTAVEPRAEVRHLVEVMHDFVNPPAVQGIVVKSEDNESPGISLENREAVQNKALSVLLAPLYSVMEKQGDANSVADICTPLLATLLPLWRNWAEPTK